MLFCGQTIASYFSHVINSQQFTYFLNLSLLQTRQINQTTLNISLCHCLFLIPYSHFNKTHKKLIITVWLTFFFFCSNKKRFHSLTINECIIPCSTFLGQWRKKQKSVLYLIFQLLGNCAFFSSPTSKAF